MVMYSAAMVHNEKLPSASSSRIDEAWSPPRNIAIA